MGFADVANGGPVQMAGVPANSKIIELNGVPVTGKKAKEKINRQLEKVAKRHFSRTPFSPIALTLTLEEDHLPHGWNLEVRLVDGKLTHAYVNSYHRLRPLLDLVAVVLDWQYHSFTTLDVF